MTKTKPTINTINQIIYNVPREHQRKHILRLVRKVVESVPMGTVPVHFLFGEREIGYNIKANEVKQWKKDILEQLK